MRIASGLGVLVLLSGPAVADDAKPKDWTSQMGDVPFVVGMEAGRAEVKFTGKPAMLFFTSATSDACKNFAARTWKRGTWQADHITDDVNKWMTPVLIDADCAQATAQQVGSHAAGWFSYQPLWDVITAEQPDLFD